MGSIIDFVQTEADDYGFEHSFSSNRYGATVTVLTDEGDPILVVTQSYYETVVTCWSWTDEDTTFEETRFDKDWDEDVIKDYVHQILDCY